MQVKKVGDTLLVRIDRGEEIVASLLDLARKEQIQLASVTGLGAVDHVVFGTYGVEQKAFIAAAGSTYPGRWFGRKNVPEGLSGFPRWPP